MRRGLSIVATMVALVVTFAACGSDDSSSGTSTDAAAAPALGEAHGTPEKSDVSIGFIQDAEHAAAYLAVDKGFFREEGINAKLKIIQSPPAAVSAMAGGSLDVAGVSYFSVFLAEQQGIDMSVMMEGARTPDPPTGLFWAVRGDSGIKTIADLKGKRVAVPSLNSVCHLGGAAVAESRGVKMDEIQFVEVPFPDMPAALERGNVDAACLFGELYEIVRRASGARVLLDVNEAPVDHFPFIGWVASAKWVEQYPNTASAVYRALAKAQDYARTHPDEVVDSVVKHTGIPHSVVVDQGLPTYPAAGDLDFQQLRRVTGLLQESGALPKDFDIRKAVEPR